MLGRGHLTQQMLYFFSRLYFFIRGSLSPCSLLSRGCRYFRIRMTFLSPPPFYQCFSQVVPSIFIFYLSFLSLFSISLLFSITHISIPSCLHPYHFCSVSSISLFYYRWYNILLYNLSQLHERLFRALTIFFHPFCLSFWSHFVLLFSSNLSHHFFTFRR